MEDRNRALWREACGPVPSGFAHSMRTALLRQAAQARPRRRQPVLAAALGLVLLLGGAFALERLGLLDTLSMTLQKSIQPGAEELIAVNIPQQAQQPQLATFLVEEAVYDGRQAYFTLRVQPKDAGKVLLMDQSSEAAWAWDWQQKDSPFDGVSFAEKAEDAGQMLVQAEVWDAVINGQGMQPQVHRILQQQEELLYTLSLPAQGERADIHLALIASPPDVPAGDADRGTLDFALAKSPDIQLLEIEKSMELPEAGLTLVTAQLELTPLASYLTLRYALAEQATLLQAVNFGDGLWADWLDEDGKPREMADQVNALHELPDGQKEVMMSFGALEEVPTEMTLSLYNSLTRKRLETVTLTLTHEEDL